MPQAICLAATSSSGVVSLLSTSSTHRHSALDPHFQVDLAKLYFNNILIMTASKNIVVMLDLYIIRMGHLFISGGIPNPAGKAKNTTPTSSNANKLA